MKDWLGRMRLRYIFWIGVWGLAFLTGACRSASSSAQADSSSDDGTRPGLLGGGPIRSALKDANNSFKRSMYSAQQDIAVSIADKHSPMSHSGFLIALRLSM